MDDDARKILNEGWATVSRLANPRVTRRDVHPDDDPLVRWSKLRQRSAPPSAQPQSPSLREIERIVDARIVADRAANAWRKQAAMDAIGQVIGETRAKLREEIAAAVDELRAEFNVIRTLENNRETSGQVIDLPALPSLRRRHGNAA